MNVLHKLDLWLIENVFERIGFWFQRKSAINAQTIAWFFLWAIIFTVMVEVGVFWFPTLVTQSSVRPTLGFVLVDILVLTGLFIATLRMPRELERQSGGSRLANPKKIIPIHRMMRLYFLLYLLIFSNRLVDFVVSEWRAIVSLQLTPQFFVGLLLSSLEHFMLLQLYFSACDIFPPQEKKLTVLEPVPVKVLS